MVSEIPIKECGRREIQVGMSFSLIQTYNLPSSLEGCIASLMNHQERGKWRDHGKGFCLITRSTVIVDGNFKFQQQEQMETDLLHG